MKTSKTFCITLLSLMCVFALSSELCAQSAAQSKDYWVSYLPSKKPMSATRLLMCTNVPGTKVDIIYSEDPLNPESTISLEPGKAVEYAIRVSPDGGSFMSKPNREEVIQRKSMHVVANHPISLQGFTDDNNNVGLFLILPTSSLGQKYVIAAFNDQPQIGDGGGNWTLNGFDSTSGAFVITAVENNTDVTIHAHSPTRGGHKAGETWTVTLNQGETYWVQGAASDDQDDLSQSVVTSTKPVAIVAGCEIMRAWDAMVIAGHFDYNDFIVEQMIPVETWGTDYVSAPFTNKKGTNLDSVGDLYRIYAYEPTTISFNGRVQPRGTYWEFPLTTEPVRVTSDNPVMVVMYDYYFDIHEANHPRTSNTEMVLVPRHNWRKNATFKVPQGYALTYFAVAAQKDSIDDLTVTVGNSTPLRLRDLPPGLKYTIGNYAVRIVQLNQPKQASINGKTDFAVYNYGTRDDDAIKATYGYASAAAASFGSPIFSRPPHMKLDSNCTSFDVTLTDPDPAGRGFGDMYLLYDPKGQVYHNTPYVSFNTSLVVDKFSLGDTVITAHVTVDNPLKDAYAALYATNRAGRDTVFTFHYSGTSLIASPDTVSMLNVLYGAQSSGTITITNNGKGNVVINGLSLWSDTHKTSPPSDFSVSANQKFPVTLAPGATMTIDGHYTPSDLGILHTDTILIQTGCFIANLAVLRGSGAVPVIFATNLDFAQVSVGDTLCKEVTVQNYSHEKELVLTKDVLNNSKDFIVDPVDLARMPITLTLAGTPGDHTTMHVCFAPSAPGTQIDTTTWGRVMPVRYQDTIKAWSELRGFAISPSLHWDLNLATANRVCSQDTTFQVILKNTGSASVNINDIKITGPDAAEFTITKVGSQSPPYQFPLTKGTQMVVDVNFKANTASPNPWRDRLATLNALARIDRSDTTLTVSLKATLTHPQLAISTNTIDFGEMELNKPYTQTVTVSNTGTADAQVTLVQLSDPVHFSIVSGLVVGQIIPKGGSVPVVIQMFSADAGLFKCVLQVGESSLCRTSFSADIQGNAQVHEVLATGADYGKIWTCEAPAKYVTFTNNGSTPVSVINAYISKDPYNGLPAKNTNEFMFDNPGPNGILNTKDTVLFANRGYVVQPHTTISLPIVFVSNILDTARGTITFVYDSAGNEKHTVQQLIGIGHNYPVNVNAGDNTSPYRAQVDQRVTVPISIKEDLGVAQVYGYEFYVELPIDMFDITSVDQGDMPYKPAFNIVKMTGNDSTYLVHIQAYGNTPIADKQHILAQLQLQTRLAKQLNTSISIYHDSILFYHQDRTTICYTPATIANSTYIQDMVCGQDVLHRDELNGLQGVISAIDNSPNPFHQTTAIHFQVNRDKTPVAIEIFDQLGAKVATVLQSEMLSRGPHSVEFDGSRLPSGSYICRVTATGDQPVVFSRRMTLSK